MFHRWPALVLVLVFCAATPKHAVGQQEQSPQHPGAGKLGNSWPNPFNPVVNTPFTVGSGSCASGEQHAVSVRILNILAQPVVVPILYRTSANSTSSSASSLFGSPITNMSLACGDYVAFWNGKVSGGGKDAASGTYIVQILVDGKLSDTKRIYYRK